MNVKAVHATEAETVTFEDAMMASEKNGPLFEVAYVAVGLCTGGIDLATPP